MRLPVNLFLYVATAGLLGLSGYTFLQSQKESTNAARTAISEAGRRDAEDRLSEGKGAGASSTSWNYQTAAWKARFLAPNLVGKELRSAEDTKPVIDPAQQVQRADVRPLHEIIELVSLMCDTSMDGKGGQSHVIVRYKDAANVQPPSWYLLENQAATPMAASTGAADGVARQGRQGGGTRGGARNGPATPVPTSSAGQEYLQRVWVAGDGTARNEATLWPPFQDIRLVRVDRDARSAYFVRGAVGATSPEGQATPPAEEELFKSSMEISEDVMRAVVEIQRTDPSRRGNLRPETAQAPLADRWKNVDETTLIGNQVMISQKDQAKLQDSPEEFLDRIQVDTYVSRTGSGVRGLRVMNIAPEISSRIGVQSNDLILSLNGEPVSTKADAIAVGKRQYNRGVRTFVLRLLSDGREVERIIEAPDR